MTTFTKLLTTQIVRFIHRLVSDNDGLCVLEVGENE